MFAVAAKKVADERCSQCGTPAWWAYSSDERIDFKVEDHTCQACAARDKAEEGKERKPGTVKTVRTAPVAYEDGTEEVLPTRTDFYERLAKEAEWAAKVKANPELLDAEAA